MNEEHLKKLEDRVTKLELFAQTLEERISNLENGEFGTGVYLEGCSEADAEYIKSIKENKVGE